MIDIEKVDEHDGVEGRERTKSRDDDVNNGNGESSNEDVVGYKSTPVEAEKGAVRNVGQTETQVLRSIDVKGQVSEYRSRGQ